MPSRSRATPVPKAKNNREMLEAVLAAEIQAGKDYTQRAKEAEEFGDKGLAVQLEDMVRDEMGHSEESERMLRDWPSCDKIPQALHRNIL